MILETIHLLLGNLVCIYNLLEVYVYQDDPWMGIIADEVFEMRYTKHTLKVNTPG